jgi:hypothetical protein
MQAIFVCIITYIVFFFLDHNYYLDKNHDLDPIMCSTNGEEIDIPSNYGIVSHNCSHYLKKKNILLDMQYKCFCIITLIGLFFLDHNEYLDRDNDVDHIVCSTNGEEIHIPSNSGIVDIKF